jgi:hypothetical protein
MVAEDTMKLRRNWKLASASIALVTLALLLTGGADAQSPKSPTAAGDNTIVVAELFTSEGCGRCPPADELLRDLVRDQPYAGITVLGLSEHVHYWNEFGWYDPFSSVDITRRQFSYFRNAFPKAGVYTPQLVVDGRLEAIGSLRHRVDPIILEAAKSSKAEVDVTATPVSGELHVTLNISVPETVEKREVADVLVGVAEDNLSTLVRRGLNRGKTLTHMGVVRALAPAAKLAADERSLSTTWTLPLEPEWKLQDLRVIAFVQEQKGRRIIGAGVSKIPAATAASSTLP